MPIIHTQQAVKAVVSDVTATRAVDTIYQNTSGRPMLVVISYSGSKGAAADNCYGTMQIEDATPPTAYFGNAGFAGAAGTALQDGFFWVTATVPNNYYYRLTKTEGGSSALTLNKWVEVEL